MRGEMKKRIFTEVAVEYRIDVFSIRYGEDVENKKKYFEKRLQCVGQRIRKVFKLERCNENIIQYLSGGALVTNNKTEDIK